MESVIWLIFIMIFALLARHHWNLTKLAIDPKKLFGEGTQAQIMANMQHEMPTGLVMFIGKFNQEYRDLNRKLAWGYVAAAGTAFVSCFLSLHLI